MTKSPEVLEANFLNMEKQIEANQKLNASEHQEIKELLAEGINALGKKIDEISNQKADRWVEKVVGGFIIFMLSGVFTYIGTLIYKVTISLK